MQVIDLIEKVKTKAELKSDYALAKTLNLTTARVSEWRTGKRTPDNYSLTRMALILGIEPIEIIAEIEAETEKNEQKRTFWRNFRSRSGKATVIVLALSFTAFWSNVPLIGNATASNKFTDYPIMRSLRRLFTRRKTPRTTDRRQLIIN